MSTKVSSKKSKTKSISSRVVSKDTKNVYKTDKTRIDRNEVNTDFTSFEIEAKEVSTVILLLDSEEFEIVEKVTFLSNISMFKINLRNTYSSGTLSS